MNRHLAHVCCALVLGAPAVSFDAGAACTAGNPNALVAESTPTGAFTDHGDGTVTHNLTGLMWKRCIQGLSDAGCNVGTAIGPHWSGALAAALADRTAGYGDWRLPNRKELESLVESCGFIPAINQALFPATPVFGAWTSTTYAQDPTLAWEIGFSDGHAIVGDKLTASFTVRLVRGGVTPDAFDASRSQSTLDIDGNGTANALTDGLLVLRYLFGLRGPALIQGAVGAGALRMSAPEIETRIQSLLP